MPLFDSVVPAVRLTALSTLLAVLAACGGGGGGDAPPAYSGPVALSGTATYDAVPASNSGGLNYQAIEARPIRGATVQLLDSSGQVLATARTDAQGRYSFDMSAAQTVQIRVRAEIKPADGTADITVRDNTQGEALYVLDSGLFSPDAATATRDLRATSGWGGSSYSGTRAAGPFAILDVAYQGQQKIASVAPTRALPALRMFWSQNNRPVEGDVTAGEITTSFYSRTTAGGHVLFILGAENTDTDEYDRHVVAHEFGHFIAAAVSRDDSIGGSHALGNKLDKRVAFSEGYANAWAGMVLGSPRYTDSGGAGQAAGFAIDLSQAPAGADRGWYSETTVQYLLWTLHAQAGFAPVYSALDAMRTAPAFNSIYTFANALPGGTPFGLAAVQIFGSGPYGTGESNDGANVLNLPIYKDLPVGVTQTHCLRADAGSDGNKLGNTLFLKFTLGSGTRAITVSRNAASAALQTDPDFDVIGPGGGKQTFDSANPNSESAVVTGAGTHSLALMDYNFAGSAQRCFDITVN